MIKWDKGRQNSGYSKLTFFISKKLLCDFYLLYFPKGTDVPKHKDPVNPGFRHHRVNFTLWGTTSPGQRMFILGQVKRWWRFEYFRPDLYEHGLPIAQTNLYMLSFGWLTKDTQ